MSHIPAKYNGLAVINKKYVPREEDVWTFFLSLYLSFFLSFFLSIYTPPPQDQKHRVKSICKSYEYANRLVSNTAQYANAKNTQ